LCTRARACANSGFLSGLTIRGVIDPYIFGSLENVSR
jgi:hypothetical protein